MSCPLSYELALYFHNTTYQRNEDGSCLFLSLDKFDYLQCVEQCGNLNSTMATPQSFIEERTLRRRIWPDEGDMWWLGGYRSSLTDDFVWQDGSDFVLQQLACWFFRYRRLLRRRGHRLEGCNSISYPKLWAGLES